MKVITLTQPWASLVAIGAKRIETRSWSTAYRGPLAIHAAKTPDKTGAVVQAPFFSTLKAAGLDPMNLPHGAIVAVCELRDCRIIGVELNGIPTYAADDMITAEPVWEPERSFGDYRAGRFAWVLTDIRRLPEPIPAKGALGLWNWDGEVPS